jgi:hypothetical protein
MEMSNRLPILAAEIRKAHADIQDAAKTAAERAISAGHALIEAKGLVKHGEWLSWLREHCALSERTAQLYMKLAKSGHESATIADLGLNAAAKALHLTYSDFFHDPFTGGSEEERREWWMFCLYLTERLGWHPEGVTDHVDWIARKEFKTPAEWLTDGPKWMARCGIRMAEGLAKPAWFSPRLA